MQEAENRHHFCLNITRGVNVSCQRSFSQQTFSMITAVTNIISDGSVPFKYQRAIQVRQYERNQSPVSGLQPLCFTPAGQSVCCDKGKPWEASENKRWWWHMILVRSKPFAFPLWLHNRWKRFCLYTCFSSCHVFWKTERKSFAWWKNMYYHIRITVGSVGCCNMHSDHTLLKCTTDSNNW